MTTGNSHNSNNKHQQWRNAYNNQGPAYNAHHHHRIFLRNRERKNLRMYCIQQTCIRMVVNNASNKRFPHLFRCCNMFLLRRHLLCININAHRTHTPTYMYTFYMRVFAFEFCTAFDIKPWNNNKILYCHGKMPGGTMEKKTEKVIAASVFAIVQFRRAAYHD